MNLYQEEILDHYKHPRNQKHLENPTASVEVINPLCGDTLRLGIIVADDKIVDVGFEGTGCAISQAAMSMVTEEILEKPVSVLQDLEEEKVLEMLGVEIGPARLKCALLSLQAIKKLQMSLNDKKMSA